MRALIGTTLLADAKARPRSPPIEIHDTRLCGFTLRVHPGQDIRQCIDFNPAAIARGSIMPLE